MRVLNEQLDYTSTIRVPESGLLHPLDERSAAISLPNIGRVARPLISRFHIQKRIEQLAAQIAEDTIAGGHCELQLLVIREGALSFAGSLIPRLKSDRPFKVKTNYLTVSSYYGNMVSSGKTKISGKLPSLKNKRLLLIEDIVDTGRTISALKDFLLSEKEARSVRVCALLDKPARRSPDLLEKSRPDYAGFQIPDLFVAGYGLDYDGFLRELTYVVCLAER